MSGIEDTRSSASVTLSALGSDLHEGLRIAAVLGCRGVQISAGQPGSRPADLSDSGRRDLLAAARRHELMVTGVDAWVRTEDFLDKERVDSALSATFAAMELAADLGCLPLSLKLPREEEAADVVEAIMGTADRIGVPVLDHGVPVMDGELPLGVGIDTPSWLAAGEDVLAGVQDAGTRLGAVRLADLSAEGMRTSIGGKGSRVDVAALMMTARVVGFQGMWLIDARMWNDVIGGVRQSLSTIGSL